jgi:hypothetical protein
VGQPRAYIPSPEKILNRLTADWYVDWCELRLRRLRALIAFMRGDLESARTELTASRELDQWDAAFAGDGFPSTYARLSAAIHSGTMYGTPAEYAFFTDRDRVRLYLAEWAFFCEQESRAQKLYSELRSHLKTRDTNAIAYVDYLQALLAWRAHDDERAKVLADRFNVDDGPIARHPSYARAQSLLAEMDHKQTPRYLMRAIKYAPNPGYRLHMMDRLATWYAASRNFSSAQLLIDEAQRYAAKQGPEIQAQADELATSISSLIQALSKPGAP